VWLNGEGAPVVFVANGKEVRRSGSKDPALRFPGGATATPPSLDGVLAIDWNNDQRNDLLLAGAGGLRFYQQDAKGNFADVTQKIKIEPHAKLPKDILNGDYYGAWAADIEM